MKSSKQEHIQQNNSSISYVLPSDLEDDNISDKEVDSYRQHRKPSSSNQNLKTENVENLDSSFTDANEGKKDFKKIQVPNKQSPQDLDLIKSEGLLSPIQRQEQDQEKHSHETQSNKTGVRSAILTLRHNDGKSEQKQKQSQIQKHLQYRKMITDKIAPQSQLKFSTSPERNPQSQISQKNNNNASLVVPLSESNNGLSQNARSSDTNNKQCAPQEAPQNQFQIKQAQNVIKKKSIKTKNNHQSVQGALRDTQPQNRSNHRRGPSMQSNMGPELTLDDDSYERDRFRRERSLYKDGPELFNDDSMVSAIQRSDHIHQFMDENELEDEDTSARRLIGEGSQNNLMRQKNQQQFAVDERTANHTKQNSTLGGFNTKDLINFVDQSKDEPNIHDRPFPIIKNNQKNHNRKEVPSKSQQLDYNKGFKSNKVAPIQTNNIINEQNLQKKSHEETKYIENDYFQFGDQDTQGKPANEGMSRNKKNSLLVHSSTDKPTAGSHNGIHDVLMINTQASKNKLTQDGDDIQDESEHERSCLLDESIIKKQLYMPNVQASRIQIQQEIGHIIQREDVRFHDELIENNQDDSFYRIVDKDSIEIVDAYYDRCPCLSLRKLLMKLRVYINRTALAIITNSIFETISIMVIIANSMFLAMDDPLAVTTPVYANYSEIIFQALYSAEMVLKILALGFIIKKGSYLRDSWNMLDFIIVMSGYIGYIFQGGGANLSVLRSFRVIRPLRTISSIQGLRIIVQALISSLPLLGDTILVLLFFFVIFAIAGVQLFTGELKNRCFYQETGLKDSFNTICAADTDCLPLQFCGKSNQNPNYGATSFDNVLYAMLLIFQTVTLEGWTSNMRVLEQAVATWVIVYFIPIVFIGAFFLLNLTLAVIKSKFTEEMKKNKLSKSKKKKKNFKKKGIDDDSENEDEAKIEEDGLDQETKMKEKIEAMSIQQIEDDKTISPEQRRQIKQKRKLEDLIKKMEIAMKQKEIKGKITPREGSLSESLKQRTKNRHRSSDRVLTSENHQVFNVQNYGQLFQHKSNLANGIPHISDFDDKLDIQQSQLIDFSDSQKVLRSSNQKVQAFKLQADETIKEDDDESHDLTVFLEQDANNHKPKTADGNLRRNSKKNFMVNNMIGINGIRKQPKQNNGNYQTVSSWLGQVFELENSRENKHVPGKVVMGGFAGIKNRKMGASQQTFNVGSKDLQNEEQMKKAAYEKLQQNFDIFEFLDNDDQFGDDELSNEEDNQKNLVEHMIQELEIEERNPNDGSGNNQGNPLERKSTIATTETKSFTKRNTIQRRSSRETYQNENHTNGDVIIQSEKLEDFLMKPKNGFKRRKTQLFKHGGYQENQQDNENVEVSKKSFKQKALAIFNKSPKKAIKNPLLNDSNSGQNSLNASINQFKDSMRQTFSKSQPRPAIEMGLNPQNFTAMVNQKEQVYDNDVNMYKQQTVRAKSDNRRKKALHKETVAFNERQVIMKKKRNIFFAGSVKQLGKTKFQIKKENNEKILKKRFISLGGGFEMPSPKSPKYRLRKLLRSGSMNQDFNHEIADQIDIDDKRKKPSFVDDEFINDIKQLKEEVKQNDDEEEDRIPDIEEVLQMKKKKISLKLKNYKFTSIHDVFEDRDDLQKEKAKMHGQNIEHKAQPPIQKKPEKKNYKKIKGFQKKIILQPKRFQQDLDDIKDSDDNQDEALKKLEDLYNKTHKSDIYVTGTLSIVFEKPKHENKMMNINYYYNIHPEQFLDNQGQKNQALNNSSAKNSQSYGRAQTLNNNNNNNIFISAFGEPERLESKESIYDNNMSIGSLGVVSVGKSLEQSGRKDNNRNQKNSLNISRRSNFPNSGSLAGRKKHPLKRSSSGVSSQNKRSASQGAGGSGMGRTAITSVFQYLPRPEVMTDRQILKRLNNEVKRSKVFQSVNFKTLPDKINRKLGDAPEIKHKKMKKNLKKKTKNINLLENQEEEISDTSEDQEGYDEDYFIDRDINNQEEVFRAKVSAQNRGIDNVEWSGQDIMTRFDPYKARIALDSLNKIRIWPHGLYGYFKRWRTLLKNIMKHSMVENLMTVCVFANTIILSMDRYGIDENTQSILTSFNTFFTIIFSVEMFLKIFGIGIVKWLRDKMNYMDGFIVILSLVELIFMSGSGAFSAFKSIRMLRTLRVLRVARLLRGLKSMINIIQVIQRSLSSFVYLGMLLFLFIFIFALLGMQLFGGNFLGNSYRYNFDSFNQSFVTSFILLTMENWNQVLFNAMQSEVNKAISVVYFISCIFIGNFMLLNLFLAILLDAFTSVDEEDHETAEKKQEIERQKREALKEKIGEELIAGFEEIEGDNKNENGKKKKKKKKKKVNKGDMIETNILDESVEIDMEALELKKQQTIKQKHKVFEGVECVRSLYFFTKDNFVRIFSYKLVQDNRFENFILVLIILSSIKLIYDTYLFASADDDPQVIISAKFDLIFTVLFTGECALKCIAYGFVQDKNSYLRETWSQMDFFIVVTSLIDAIFSGVNIPIIKILRLLRILRPLRFISHNSSMKTVVIALLSSLGAILNVGIVVICIFLMFSILGVNLFAGKLQYCSVNPYVIDEKIACFKNRGEWKTYNQNFDNSIQGMLTLFSVATLEGWPDLMYTYTDITGLETGPKPAASPLNAYFFVAFVFIGAFFFMNLFVGVLFMNFEAAQRDEKEAMLLEGSEIKWVDMMKMIVDAKPEIVKIPKNRLSQFMHNFTKADSKFDIFVMICIILNMFQMAMTYETQTVQYTKGLEYINYFFTAVFTVECIFKMIGNGNAYFIPTWHKFDFFVVLASYLDIVMGQLSASSLKMLRVGPQVARVLRVLRVSRLFRLLNKYKGLQALLQTITFSLPSLFNVFALLMLVYFIFSVLGVFMFRGITQGVMIDPIYFNFANFSQAMIILLRISTGEDWPTIMYDTMNTSPDCIPDVNCGISYAPIFFIIFVMLQSYVMLNLFVLIILQQFELYYLPHDNILQKFRLDLDTFKLTWAKYAKEYSGIKIKALDLVAFFKHLEGNLGFGHAGEQEILRNIVKMDLESDEDGFIYFNELLYKAMKRIYGQERTKKKILIECELNTLEKLLKIKQKMLMSDRKNERIKAVTVNPFLAVMYKNMSFKAWIKIYKTNIIKRAEEYDFQVDRESSDDEQNQLTVRVDDDEYAYETEQDILCDSDDENFDNDSSQKNLLSEKSVNALINSLNSDTPVAIRGGDSNNLQFKVQYTQNLLDTPSKNFIDIQDQSLDQNSGFKIKLQQTQKVQIQQLAAGNVDHQGSPPIHKQLQQQQKSFFANGLLHMNDTELQQEFERDSSSYREDEIEDFVTNQDQYVNVIDNEDIKNFHTEDHLNPK